MSKEIKTRQVHKDVKALDKTVIGMERVKCAYVRTKESVESAQPHERRYATSTEYAEDRVEKGVDHVSHEAVYQARKQGGRLVDKAKEIQKNSKETKEIKQSDRVGSNPPHGEPSTSSHHSSLSGSEELYQPKEQMKKKAQEKAAQKKATQQRTIQRVSQQTSEQQPQIRELPKRTIKTIDRGEKTIKTAEKAGQTVKNTGKGTVKSITKSVKTAEQTADKAIKTSQVSAKASVKTAEKAVRVTRQTVKVEEQAAKAAVKATTSAVKALIVGTKTLIATIAAGGWIAIFILIIVVLFGGILCIVGGSNSSTASPVSEEVEAYEPIIRIYANQYGIGEYVELIKAVMMQESGGRGSDPMQSSESSYNIRYPREQNGITNPEYSIECGVQALKDCLQNAGVENPIDMEHIKLALQGYNFGNGYISWAKSNYGGYTIANASEFSDMMARRMRWSGYGDKQYVPHVLRYYVFGRISTGIGSQAIVQVALTQEGNRGDIYWNWYGFNSREEWCACFVSWCAEQCGYLESGVIPKFSSCSEGVAWFNARGQFQDASYVPTAGDIIFFDWESDGTVDHVGIVEIVTNGIINTIEGNSGDVCARRSYSMSNDSIYGYGVPLY